MSTELPLPAGRLRFCWLLGCLLSGQERALGTPAEDGKEGRGHCCPLAWRGLLPPLGLRLVVTCGQRQSSGGSVLWQMLSFAFPVATLPDLLVMVLCALC